MTWIPPCIPSLRKVICTPFRNSHFCSRDLYLRHSIQSRWASLESHVTKPARDQVWYERPPFYTLAWRSSRLTLVFWLSLWILGILVYVISLTMVGKALHLEDVFLVFFDGIGVSTHYRGVVATTTFSATLAPRASLVLVLLARLTLVVGRLLVLATRISAE